MKTKEPQSLQLTQIDAKIKLYEVKLVRAEAKVERYTTLLATWKRKREQVKGQVT